MPICKKCNQRFPNRIILDGKEKFLNSRSYCLTCSPIGINMGYDLRKRSTDESYKKITDDINVIECKICNRHYPRKKRNNLECSTCRSNYTRYKHKKKAIDILGGKCNICNEMDNDVLQFHHKNPEEKSFTLSGGWGNKDWKLLKEEIDKCILLCANCHIKLHRKNIQKIFDYFEKKVDKVKI